MAAVAQPSVTVTLVFTDIEGSTKLLERLGVEAYREALAEHRRIVREACARHGVDPDSDPDRIVVQPTHRLRHGGDSGRSGRQTHRTRHLRNPPRSPVSRHWTG